MIEPVCETLRYLHPQLFDRDYVQLKLRDLSSFGIGSATCLSALGSFTLTLL